MPHMECHTKHLFLPLVHAQVDIHSHRNGVRKENFLPRFRKSNLAFESSSMTRFPSFKLEIAKALSENREVEKNWKIKKRLW